MSASKATTAATKGRQRYYHFAPPADLPQTAERLGAALGFQFSEEKTGFYEEFPAFEAKGRGLFFALLGIPDPRFDCREIKSADFELQIEVEEEGHFATTPEIDSFVLDRLSQVVGIALKPSQGWS